MVMDFEAIDREMSCWVVTNLRDGTRFYIADNESETATDIWSRAKRFRWHDQAQRAASEANRSMFSGWAAISVPQAMNQR
jgi:hypothetical protein